LVLFCSDFNYERDQTDGTCKLVPGFQPPDHSEYCKKNPDAIEYYEPTGYRRIPLSTCEGKNLEWASKARPCPGHEKEFDEKRRISGFGLFLAIVFPIGAATAVGYWVWRNWDGKFGRIRLGEATGTSFDRDSPFVRYPVIFLSGLIAVIGAMPLLASSLWRSARGWLSGLTGGRRYTSRQSFARDRGAYAVVDEDEGELLGDESDEEA
jgi:hypothetical protein